MSQCLDFWRQLTSDRTILQTVSGEIVEFISDPPAQTSHPPNSVAKGHTDLLAKEIESLVSKNVLRACNHTLGEFISPIFTVPKKDGGVRLILNLKKFNSFVENYHFKMDNIKTILELITPNCWMAVVDLKDAYYSVPVHPKFRKYLRFIYEGQLYEYTVFPNGLCICPRKFTKLMKPILAHIHALHHIISGYIDDFYLQGHTCQKCVENVVTTVKIFDNVGLIPHPQKSVLIPAQEIVLLGFVINSISMTIKLTVEKKEKIKILITQVKNSGQHVSIRLVARLIGCLVASLPAVMHGALYYKYLEKEKIVALHSCKGNFDGVMLLSGNAMAELNWWSNNIDISFNRIRSPPVDIVLHSDASLQGWGAVMGKISTGGRWSAKEATCHINVLELHAVLLALRCFKTSVINKHVKILVDNTTAVATINHMGSVHSDACHLMVRQIWEFCIAHNIWLTAAHLPGSANVDADYASRNFSNIDTEWMLNTSILTKAIKTLQFQPEIDLFASRLNKKFEKYCAFHPDPDAIVIDAFSISWSNLKFYSFPPFSCILKALQKIIPDQTTGIFVAPNWMTQAWYPILTSLLIAPPVVCKPSRRLLTLPSAPDQYHPLHKKLELHICLLSGKTLNHRDILKHQ